MENGRSGKYFGRRLHPRVIKLASYDLKMAKSEKFIIAAVQATPAIHGSGCERRESVSRDRRKRSVRSKNHRFPGGNSTGISAVDLVHSSGEDTSTLRDLLDST